ncbi:MAG: superinfection exclusion B family protein [Clostridia bacterium]|nr:superinfection exclusion B family protein [Clostridia bacterium]
MDWITKLINILKIPLKVLLPAICIFSGFLLFASDELLEKMNLFSWSAQNGFIFGLLFLISLSFILVYFIAFIINQTKEIWFKATFDRKNIKRIIELNLSEQSVLAKLYNSPGYTATYDYNQPIIKGLVNRNYLYGGNQTVATFAYSNKIPVNLTLQPFVWKTIDKYLPIFKKNIIHIENRLKKVKSEKRKNKLQNEKENIQYFCDLFDGKLFD